MRDDSPFSTEPPRSMFAALDDYPVPDWLITEDFLDEEEGVIKSGKEGDVTLVSRRDLSGRENLLAYKRYRPPSTRAFRRDQIYREGRRFRRTRDLRAVEIGTRYGRLLMSDQWSGVEFQMLRRLWPEGVSVPYPVHDSGGLLMQFIGDASRAAPRLADARPSGSEAADVFELIEVELTAMTRSGVVHGDLSAFNVLLWEGRVWIIDLPQAVDLYLNPHGFDLLHRDVSNICAWFARRGVVRDAGEVFGRLLERAVAP